MNTHIHPVTLDDVMAYVDGQLATDRRLQVDAAIRADAQLAERIAALRAQRQALHKRYDAVLAEPIPVRLLATRRTGTAWLRVAPIAIWLGIGAGLGSILTWQYVAQPNGAPASMALNSGEIDLPRFVHQATVAHIAYAPEVRHPVEIYSAQEQRLVSWLSRRLDRQLRAPHLGGAGFRLVGGRLLPGEVNKPAAQFMYENRAGQRITLYLRGMAQPTPESAFRFTWHGGIATFYWVDRDWGYALSGGLPRAVLLNVATSVHRQLDG